MDQTAPRGGRLRLLPMALVGSLLAAVLVGPAPAGAAGAQGVRIGAAPRSPAGATTLEPLNGNAVLHVTVALAPRDPSALAQFAHDVSTPGSSQYRHYLGPGEFAGLFGPSDSSITAVKGALRAAGLTPGSLSANHLALHVNATAAALSRAFATTFHQFRLRSGRTAYANSAAPRVSAQAAPYVQAVLGLDDLFQFTSRATAASTAGAPGAAARPHVVTGGPQPCGTAVDNASSQGVFTADQLASAYGFSNLYGAGDLGAGQTVALVEFEPDSPADIAAYQSCYATSTAVSYVKVDGGAGSGKGQGEAALDIEDVLGLAPRVSILVYQAPNTDAASIDLLDAIVGQDSAKVVSTSWGLCEPFEQQSGAAAEATIFQQAAAQGQSFFAAAGDQGSEDCAPDQGGLAVDDPGSQPYVTGVGGTTMSALGPPPSETVWNEGPSSSCCAGGGGISSFWAMPGYQSGAAPSVGTVNGYSSGAPCAAPAGHYCREDPDVSAVSAGGNSGYLVFWDGFWTGIGGTSAAAPLWAALVALTNASGACHGVTVGFANPDLYGVAASDPAAFHDITSGNNDMTGTESGSYPATSHYDMASGLGTPNGAHLPADLCASPATTPAPVTVTNPGLQTSLVAQPVSVQIAASDTTAGQTLSFAALGLPGGLSISSSGLVTGSASVSGKSTVVVTAKDGNGASDSVTFTWSVPASVRLVKKGFGSAAGGTRVSITGSGFAGTTGVFFGASPARSFAVNRSGTKITAVTPAGVGVVFVTVTGPSGTSGDTSGSLFDYGPVVTRIVPSSGPRAGGTKIIVSGTNFGGVTSVHFGSVAASSVIVNGSGTKLTVVAPAGAPGPAHIVVTTPGGPSPPVAADLFTYT
ncbi:MAG TPA: protease pro-enzyme activation domain-containing protein [Acidimicrobiales bacterium]|nr:protease pro-enzyme activation domain-containing protein [Acidimicrobiales bacterium]